MLAPPHNPIPCKGRGKTRKGGERRRRERREKGGGGEKEREKREREKRERDILLNKRRMIHTMVELCTVT